MTEKKAPMKFDISTPESLVCESAYLRGRPPIGVIEFQEGKMRAYSALESMRKALDLVEK